MSDDAPLRPQARPRAEVVEASARPQARPADWPPVDGGPVPAGVALAATVGSVLPLNRLTLVGLFHGPEGDFALLRLPHGGVVRAAEGDGVDGGRLAAIGGDSVRVARGPEEIVLRVAA